MIISILKHAKARVVLLVLLTLLCIVCGCSPEPVVVAIHYQADTSSEILIQSPRTMSSTEQNESDATAPQLADAQDSSADRAQPQTKQSYDSSFPVPTAIPTLQPTLTPLPTPTPTPTPIPTLTPTPLLTPSPSPTSDSLAAIEFEKERYENEIKRIQNEYHMRRHPLAAMLEHLQSKSAVSPEEAATLQAEIDALQAEINELESEAAAELHAERERHLSTLATLGG